MKFARMMRAAIAAGCLFASPAFATQASITMPTSNPHPATGFTMYEFTNSYLNPALQSIAGCFSGNSAPSSPVVYQCWANTTSNPTVLSRWDGVSWVQIATLDTSGHVYQNLASTMPAFTGDMTTSAGSVATTVGKVGGKAVSLGGAFTMSGAFTFTGTTTANTTVTYPTSGTLATTANISTALPSASTSQIYGGSGSAGTAQVVSVGTGLSLSGGTLATTGGGGAITNSVRQTTNGPIDTNGIPTVLPATSVALSITTQNVSGSAPLVVTAAQGFGSPGNVDYVTQFTTNQTWSSLPASSTVYLYINASSGALGSTTLQPIYQVGGTPSTTNGQFTFNVGQMTGYMGNGSTAPATPLVFVGEVVTSGSAVTSSIAYAYNGYYDSGWTNTLPGNGTNTSKNSNLGMAANSPSPSSVTIKNLTTEAGYSVGDITVPSAYATYIYPIQVVLTRNTISFTTGNSGLVILNKSTGVSAVPTAANWAWRLQVSRGW